MTFIVLLFALPALGLLALGAFLLVEVIGAALPARNAIAGASRGRAAIIVPAHDEEAGIAAMLESLKRQVAENDRILVVADNCSDRTADVVKALGVECVIRSDTVRRGKGWALQFGLDHLRGDPPDVVIFLDADCRADPGLVDALALAAATGPVQAIYLMQPPEGGPPKTRVAAFAWLLMNRVRMVGLDRIFGVTRLTGSGMAMPWRLAGELALGSGEIVEDLALTARLTIAGEPPQLAIGPRVYSEFPTAERALALQHARWEHGSLRLALREAPGLLAAGFRTGRVQPAALALDLAIPPLTLFAALIGISLLAGVPLAVMGAPLPLQLAFNALTVFLAGVICAWAGWGRETLRVEDLRAVFGYILSKTGVYGREARASTRTWTRTGRDTPPSPSSPQGASEVSADPAPSAAAPPDSLQRPARDGEP